MDRHLSRRIQIGCRHDTLTRAFQSPKSCGRTCEVGLVPCLVDDPSPGSWSGQEPTNQTNQKLLGTDWLACSLFLDLTVHSSRAHILISPIVHGGSVTLIYLITAFIACDFDAPSLPRGLFTMGKNKQ
ncbi:hypothetical protein PVAP13_6NG353900 [Panicum virgatum]|uniref:Uncharacterized protein n=1 Tax=Panicum virgatum TaxID=38727 RepID=A0A8T0R5Y6_PANVG|nr:hypothetical protein PVAP13_6NG353900 [Panicum virgatum]